jgi:hypothetical protein
MLTRANARRAAQEPAPEAESPVHLHDNPLAENPDAIVNDADGELPPLSEDGEDVGGTPPAARNGLGLSLLAPINRSL